ncbi:MULTISPECIES: MFS transporter [unclassified Arthrobacter]|uniref:MFS transporter n=1 Tax=unclassified Arthrobacter TaxID=235627 RepID=UPI0024E01E81|nr:MULTISPECIES: MFS transporter [unclassified Arthrobacter]MCC9144705.1 MFS transporter [Arthrobacter sp. zg-Y919]MDK1275931.1 MFS transporter [Arthrobacter sp. zg.Y919]WIB02715.1 MFS transporter [Arthrobacter sp. zg-Y919]
MSTSPAAAAPAAPSPESSKMARKVAGASFIGTALESYDFYVFGTAAALILNRIFFPDVDAATGILLSFLTLGMGFIARPLGAIIFGHIGDRVGRKTSLIGTIVLMGVATGAVGLLPDYNTIGIWAPLLLVLLRLLQGLAVGGEWGGSILIATEHAAPRKRALYAAIPQIGSPVGTILVTGIFLLLTQVSDETLAAGVWRIPFLLAFPFMGIALYMRLAIDETPVFKGVAKAHQITRVPLLEVLRTQWLAVLVAASAALLGIGSYFLMTTYTQSYGISVLGLSESTVLNAALVGSVLQLATIPAFGFLANRIGSARMVLAGAVATLLISFPLYFIISNATTPVYILTILIGGIAPTAAWAALGGLMADLFPARTGFTAMSLAYSIAGILSGFTPSITQAFSTATDGAWWHPGVVLALMSVITIAGALAAQRMTRRNTEATVPAEV